MTGGKTTSAQRMARLREIDAERGIKQCNVGGLWPDERRLVDILVAKVKARRINGAPGHLKDLQDLLVKACVTSDTDA